MTSATKTLVENLLRRYALMDWTLQGFGMLRTYLDAGHEFRLHVWDSRYQTHCVSTLHTHPWDFESMIVAGRLRNLRYKEVEGGELYMKQAIKCGMGGGLCDAPTPCGLDLVDSECLHTGDFYKQTAHEIHETIPEDGTVTLVRRTFKGDVDHAAVYWAAGTKWVSAEPIEAEIGIVKTIVTAALDRWFDGPTQ